uniref:Uncharacterized protein n=1 Tax=Coccidioides posadasii RMSCC 3488 TaxID=454284 RepID=A0A0J6HXH9_COCPO|nr:hypothetical protein CPAG_00001 [Coccidioides posadasii RMSCC 3488]
MLKLSVELQEPSHDAYKLAFYCSLAQSPEPVILSELLQHSLADLLVDYKHIAGAGLPAVDSDGISPHAHVTSNKSRSSCLLLSSPMNPDASDISSSYAAIKIKLLELPQDPLSPSQPTPDAD